MKARIDEATIRDIIRMRIARRLLSEQAPAVDPDVPVFDAGGILAQLRGGESGSQTPPAMTLADAQAASAPSYTKYGKKSSETLYDAIRRAATKNPNIKAELDAKGKPAIGPQTRQEIFNYLTTLKDAKSEFIPTNPETVMTEWQEIAPTISPLPLIGADGKPAGDPITFPSNEEGLLRYLVAIGLLEFGYEISRTLFNDGEGIIKEVKPTADALLDIHNQWITELYTSDQELRETASLLKTFIETSDSSPDLAKTKILLMYYAAHNTTGAEGWKNVAVGTALVGAVVATAFAIYATGGALAYILGVDAAAATSGAFIAVGSLSTAAETLAASTVIGAAALSTGLTYLATHTAAFAAAGASAIIAGAFSVAWCGNEAAEISDEYRDFQAAIDPNNAHMMGELRSEIDDVSDYFGTAEDTVKIKSNLKLALQAIETSQMGKSIRGQVLQYLKKAEAV